MKRANNGHGGKRRNAGRPTKIRQQLKEMYKKERRLKEEEARKKRREHEASQRQENREQQRQSLLNQRQQVYERLSTIARNQCQEEDNNFLDTDEEKVDDHGVDLEEDTSNNRTYMPPPNSVLDIYFKKIKEDVVRKRVAEERIWLAPESGPLTSTCVGEPRPWYVNNISCFIWRPFQQYKHLVDKKNRIFSMWKNGRIRE